MERTSVPCTGNSTSGQGTKRKAIFPPPSISSRKSLQGDLESLKDMAESIATCLAEGPVGDTLHLCGHAPLQVLAVKPEQVLALAYDKLNAYPYSNVPAHWRRLYEEASLYQAVHLLEAEIAIRTAADGGAKRRRIDGGVDDDWIARLVSMLDRGMSLSGAPGRRSVFEAVFQLLGHFIGDDPDGGVSEEFEMLRPPPLVTEHHIARADKLLDIEGFQAWLDNTGNPLIIPGTMADWPAMKTWSNPRYLLSLTLGGRRLVPVEIGSSYTSADWSQKMMPIADFLKTYLLPKQPSEVGYLAQHDLLTQLPALRKDIFVPDYVYTTPPPPTDAAALKTAGLASVEQLDEPLLNAWLGPKGTRTPLHTDPYHNILCQVVGYKYVRLYTPAETPSLYPRGVDENGVGMENTSQVDFAYNHHSGAGLDIEKFPLFPKAVFQEGILGPGECLYIPMGWWHYVESLSTSFSVSFWWN